MDINKFTLTQEQLSAIMITQQEHIDASRSRIQAHVDALNIKQAINTTNDKVTENNKIMSQNNYLVIATAVISTLISCVSLGVSIYALFR